MAPLSQAGEGTPAGEPRRERSGVSGKSHGRQRALFMTASGQLRGHLRAVSRVRRQSRGGSEPLAVCADYSLILIQEARIYGHVLLHPLAYLNPEPELLEQIAQPVAVDQLDRRGTVPSCLRLGVTSERSRRDEQAFLAPASHRAAKVPHGPGG